MHVKNRNRRALGGILARIGLCCLAFAAWLALFASLWYGREFGDTGFDSVLYTLFGGKGGVEAGLVVDFLLGALLPAVILTLIQGVVLYRIRRKPRIWTRLTCAALSVILLVYSALDIGLMGFLYFRSQPSQLYEKEYVDPNQVQIQFPEKKRNLIIIYLESMETTFLDQAHGGAMDVNLIPELTELAQNHVNFSHNDGVGGLVEVPGATWSVGAAVAMTSGVPLVTPSHISDWKNGYGKDGVFLPGLTTMANLLAKNGYHQALMMGCDSAFGGESVYAETHGVNKVYDLFTARKDGIVPKDYYVWWGFEDMYLFEYARQELTEMAKGDQPFAFTVLTMDTHRVDGYTCSLCGKDREEKFDNVLSCSSRQVAAFVEWIQAQPFYENTTVILTGDHFSMDSGYIGRTVEDGYERHGYNCFINAPVRPEHSKNRLFSAMDMFPTTMAALGCTIEGDRLGLGVNLFSGEETLLERYGYQTLWSELSKRAAYYDRFY